MYNRVHTLPGDPGFDDHVYEIRVTSASINPRNVVTAWVFCLGQKGTRIGGIVNANNEVMGSRLDSIIGARVLEDKVHVGFLCGLPIKSEKPGVNDAADVAFAEVILVDHGRPVSRNPEDGDVDSVMRQLMNRPEADPFCNGLRPRRVCKTIGRGIVPLHRHHVRHPKEPG